MRDPRTASCRRDRRAPPAYTAPQARTRTGAIADKAAKTVIADASPLIGLAAAEALDLLRELFGAVTVTRAVRDEIMAGGERPGARELALAMREGWIRVAPTPMETWHFPELGPGEASTIALATQHAGPALVLMDDALGCDQAAASGVQVMDLTGVLLAAKRAGLVASIRPLLERLAQSGFVIASEIRRAALEAAGEDRASRPQQ